jgi:hypothetical protein
MVTRRIPTRQVTNFVAEEKKRKRQRDNRRFTPEQEAALAEEKRKEQEFKASGGKDLTTGEKVGFIPPAQREEDMQGIRVFRDERGELSGFQDPKTKQVFHGLSRGEVQRTVARLTGQLQTPAGASGIPSPIPTGQAGAAGIQQETQQQIFADKQQGLELAKNLGVTEEQLAEARLRDPDFEVNLKKAAVQAAQGITDVIPFDIDVPVIDQLLGGLVGFIPSGKEETLKTIAQTTEEGRKHIKDQMETTLQGKTQEISDIVQNMEQAIQLASNPETAAYAKELFEVNMAAAVVMRQQVNAIRDSEWAEIVGTIDEDDVQEFDRFFNRGEAEHLEVRMIQALSNPTQNLNTAGGF